MFTSLVVSGGGIKGISSLGALYYFDNLGLLNNIDTYSGTSIGSIIIVLLASGYKCVDIFNDIYNMDSFIEDQHLNIRTIINNLIYSKGMLDIDNILYIVKKMLINKFGNIPTFAEFENITFKKIYITTTNLSNMKREVLSNETNPQLSVLDAIKMSCNLPIVFKEINYNNNYYVDGGLTSNIPLDIILDINNEINIVNSSIEKILCICTRGIPAPPTYELSLMEYIYRVMMIPINTMSKTTVQSAPENVTIIDINIENIPLLINSISKKEKMDIFLSGYHTAEYEHRKEDITDLI